MPFFSSPCLKKGKKKKQDAQRPCRNSESEESVYFRVRQRVLYKSSAMHCVVETLWCNYFAFPLLLKWRGQKSFC